jgi:Glyoxalase-like domain
MSRNMTRRDALRLWAAATVSCIVGSSMSDAQTLVSATKAVDHLLLGVPDLDRGIAWVERMTDVKAMIGGSHPGRGTRNALLSLGGRQYLEIIAPDPAQSTFGFQIDLRKLSEPRLVNWAAASTDLDGVAKRASAAGQSVAGPRDGSRQRPRVTRGRSDSVLHRMGGRDVASVRNLTQGLPAPVLRDRAPEARGDPRDAEGHRDRCDGDDGAGRQASCNAAHPEGRRDPDLGPCRAWHLMC